ncbi:ribonuclease P protein component [Methylobacterium segetis]|uniref:ribonuclease P protein component n=1 Tax=Methylobacterium segetis TaxID=2488750 RepID=UPI0010514157|nr:ribonuclease P protein component [Methylobacterium segetis]
MATIERLRRRADFLAAAAGRRFHTERMTAQGRIRESGELRDGVPATGLHLGFTITKRVGHATERNRIRRRLRQAVDAVAEEAPVTSADIVLIARRPALTAPFETLKDDLRRALAAVTKPRGPKPGGSQGRAPGAGDRGSTPTRHSGPRADARPMTEAERRLPSPDTHACDGSSNGQ